MRCTSVSSMKAHRKASPNGYAFGPRERRFHVSPKFCRLLVGPVRILFAASLVLTAVSCGHLDVSTAPASGGVVTGADLSRPPSDVLTSILQMTRTMSVNQISDRIKAEVPPLTDVISIDPEAFRTVVERSARILAFPSMVFDSEGDLHVVFAEGVIVPEPDRQGNANRWSVRLYHMRRHENHWSEPEVLPNDDLYVEPECVLFNPDGTLLVVSRAGNRIRIHRLPRSGAWSKPEDCMVNGPEIMHGVDACFDGQGRLHLVWAHWISNDESEAIRHRVLDGGIWREDVLPTLPDRNLLYPRLSLIAGRIHVHCTAQVMRPAGGRSDTFCLRQEGDGSWSVPVPLVECTTFREAIAPRERGFDAVGTGLGPAISLNPETAALAPDGWAYAPVIVYDSLILVRFGADRAAEACLLVRARNWTGATVAPSLAVRGHDLVVAWWTGASLRVWQAPPPRDGWMPMASLIWRMQGGQGLDYCLRGRIAPAVVAQARAAETDFDMPRAVEQYLYVLANFPSFDDRTLNIRRRLLNFDRAGIVDVRRQLWTLRSKDEGPNASFGPAIAWLMGVLGVRSDGRCAEHLRALPAQDRDTVHRLLEDHDKERVTVFLAGRKEAVITPDLATLKETAMYLCFASACVADLDGIEADRLDKAVLTWKGSDLDGPVPERTEYKLRELATWEIRPQHTDRLSYLLDAYRRYGCQQRQLDEIAAHIERALPLLLVAMGEGAYPCQCECPANAAAQLLSYLGRRPDTGPGLLPRILPLLASKNANERGWANLVVTSMTVGGAKVDRLREIPALLAAESDDEIRREILRRLSFLLERSECRDVLKQDRVLHDEIATQVRTLAGTTSPNLKIYVDRCLAGLH